MITKSKRPKTGAADVRVTCDILHSIAESYPVRSRERKAVSEAAEALVFLTTHEQLKASYDEFVDRQRKGLPGRRNRRFDTWGSSRKRVVVAQDTLKT